MDETGKSMSKPCAFIEKLAQWAASQAVVPVVFAGRGSHGFGNRPAPLIEICYLQEGGFDRVRMGKKTVALPCNHAAIQSVHHGNISPEQKRISSWCVFIDVSTAPQFASLHREPVFHLVEVRRGGELVQAFSKLSVRCRRLGWTSPTYPVSESFMQSRRDPADIIDRLSINAAFFELLCLLCSEADSGIRPQTMPEAVRKAIEYIDLHYCQSDTTIAKLARMSHLSADHFARLFRSSVNESPLQYLRRVRLGRSKELLHNHDMSIQSICWSVGFRDPFHFSKAFHEFAGMSPTEYRRTLRAKND